MWGNGRADETESAVRHEEIMKGQERREQAPECFQKGPMQGHGRRVAQPTIGLEVAVEDVSREQVVVIREGVAEK